ncbi:hypothetical protein DH2020_021475 [Rehmannia glutinosa]|uniref:RING-type domain-containing protein n=1 Tax=Rehmannia glutinosa TaxID=99300 RepID=A0ABR0WES8_REHGL
MDSEEEDYYYTSGTDDVEEVPEDEDGGDDEEEVAEDGDSDDEPDYASVSRRHHTHYKTLKQEEIKHLFENDISTVSNVLSVSRGVACTLLCQNNWSLSSVYEKWFSDENRIPDPVGESSLQKSEKLTCKICYETVNITNTLSADCGHLFCSDCWKIYISTSIKYGPGCLTLPEPEPDANRIQA